MPRFLFARHPDLEHIWPFVQRRLVQGLEGLGSVEVVQVPPGSPWGSTPTWPPWRPWPSSAGA